MEKKKGLLKRTVAILMSLAMVAGMFIWNGMDVKADDTYDWNWDGYDGSTGTFYLKRTSDGKYSDWDFPISMSSGQKVSLGYSDQHDNNYTIVYYLNGQELCRDTKDADGGNQSLTIGSDPKCAGYTEWTMTPVYSEDNKKVWTWRLEAVTKDAPSTGGQSDSSSATPHTHSYFWVTAKEVSLSEDGLEEYRCECGDVAERVVVPASEYYVKNLYGNIRFADPNGEVVFDAGSFHTVSDYLLGILQERKDVALRMHFTYMGTLYEAFFAPGTDYAELLNDAEQFYGVLGLNGRYGVSVSAVE